MVGACVFLLLLLLPVALLLFQSFLYFFRSHPRILLLCKQLVWYRAWVGAFSYILVVVTGAQSIQGRVFAGAPFVRVFLAPALRHAHPHSFRYLNAFNFRGVVFFASDSANRFFDEILCVQTRSILYPRRLAHKKTGRRFVVWPDLHHLVYVTANLNGHGFERITRFRRVIALGIVFPLRGETSRLSLSPRLLLVAPRHASSVCV